MGVQALRGAVTDVAELSKKGRAFAVLCHMGRHEPLNMSEFTRAAGIGSDPAKKLRLWLVEHDLIRVQEIRQQGAVEIIEIHLTPLGRSVAKKLVEVDDLLVGGSKGRRRAADA